MKLSFATLVCPGWSIEQVAANARTMGFDGYDKYLSFEWEKKWQPNLAEPELAFPHFAKFREPIAKVGF